MPETETDLLESMILGLQNEVKALKLQSTRYVTRGFELRGINRGLMIESETWQKMAKRDCRLIQEACGQRDRLLEAIEGHPRARQIPTRCAAAIRKEISDG